MPTDSLNVSLTNDVDTSIATLNTAIVLFHLRDYGRAASLLEPLYQKLHPLDETTALNVCLLLVDVALALNNAAGAADVIQYLEKSFGEGYVINQSDNVAPALLHQPPNQGPKVNALSSAVNSSEINSSDSVRPESSLDRMLSEDAIEYETFLSSLDSSGQTLTKSTAPDISLAPVDRPAPAAADLKLKTHLYKVKLLLLTRNLKAAKREVKLGMNMARGRDSSVALLLKAQLEYARGNHRKAMKLLMTSSNKSDPGLFSVFNNNLGCIYHQLQKHQTALALFSKALKNSSSLLKQEREKPMKLLAFSQDKSPLISYNCGLQLLTCQKPLPAAKCFNVAAPHIGSRPILWVRIAECCLMALAGSRAGSVVAACVLGSGKWRRLAVAVGPEAGHLEPPEGRQVYTLSLPFARQCLLNALIQLDRLETKSTVSLEGKASVDQSPSVDGSVDAYEGLCKRESRLVKQAALADLAFVELTLGNPLRALSSASELQKLPECSRVYSFFARVYAAEALARLNRPEEAVDQLSVYVSESGAVGLPFKDEDVLQWTAQRVPDQEESGASNGPGSSISPHQTSGRWSKSNFFVGPEEARVGLFVNLGLLSAVQGDFDRAKLFLGKALMANPGDPQALVAGAYVDLRIGSTSDAVAKLKGCSHVRFLANGIVSAGS
ncbi:tetratricopeptide repeat (TPR)-like superfamily protein isoform X2 [Wolffia australiana]